MDASVRYNEHQGKCDYMNILRSESNITTIKNRSPYRAVNTNRLHYKDRPVNAVEGNNRCLLWESYEKINTRCVENIVS